MVVVVTVAVVMAGRLGMVNSAVPGEAARAVREGAERR